MMGGFIIIALWLKPSPEFLSFTKFNLKLYPLPWRRKIAYEFNIMKKLGFCGVKIKSKILLIKTVKHFVFIPNDAILD